MPVTGLALPIALTLTLTLLHFPYLNPVPSITLTASVTLIISLIRSLSLIIAHARVAMFGVQRGEGVVQFARSGHELM